MAMVFAMHMAQALPKINMKGVIQYNDCHNYNHDFEIVLTSWTHNQHDLF